MAAECFDPPGDHPGTHVILGPAELSLLSALAGARDRGEARHRAAALVRAWGGQGARGALEELVSALLSRAEEVEDLRRLATSDPLTGVANRRAFEETLVRDVAQADRRNGWVAVSLIDLDGFKRLNDQLGHAAGDQALVEVARACERSLRRGDLVARLGGDEFAVLLPDTSYARAQRVVERLRHAIEARAVDGIGLRASVGLAASRGAQLDPAGLLRAADEALYADKRRRRGTAHERDETTYAFQQSSFSTRVRRRNVPVPSPSSSLSSQ